MITGGQNVMIVLVIGCTLLWALFHREMFAILFDICPQAHLLLPQLTLDLCPKSFLAHACQDSILNREKNSGIDWCLVMTGFQNQFDIDLPELLETALNNPLCRHRAAVHLAL